MVARRVIMNYLNILLVAGARPNFMKVSAIVKAIETNNRRKKKRRLMIRYILVHTGQHYQKDMSEYFFRDLDLPVPDISLGVGSGSHAEQTARTMTAFEQVCLKGGTDLVIVVGDVNSTLACALVAAKLQIPVAHVEAGLRSFDRTMPEEINRILTDQISEFLFTTSTDANRNLRREGISDHKIFLVGNVMIDTLLSHIQLAQKSQVLEKLGFNQHGRTAQYSIVTLHRPSNVDEPRILAGILEALSRVSHKIPVVFPAHPRTLNRLREHKLEGLVDHWEKWGTFPHGSRKRGILVIPPLGYLDFLFLMSRAAMVFTDSGGIQEETTILGVPCLTIRNTTERPITITQGSNMLAGNSADKIVSLANYVLREGKKVKRIPRFWDGKAAERIVEVLTNEFS